MGISTHILDTSTGRPAANVPVSLSRWANERWIPLSAEGLRTDADGRARQLLPETIPLDAGLYRVRFETARYYEAHHVTGTLVALAERKACDLPDLSIQEMTSVHPGITQSVYSVLGVENSVRSRTSYGGTAPDRVREQVARWQAALG